MKPLRLALRRSPDTTPAVPALVNARDLVACLVTADLYLGFVSYNLQLALAELALSVVTFLGIHLGFPSPPPPPLAGADTIEEDRRCLLSWPLPPSPAATAESSGHRRVHRPMLPSDVTSMLHRPQSRLLSCLIFVYSSGSGRLDPHRDQLIDPSEGAPHRPGTGVTRSLDTGTIDQRTLGGLVNAEDSSPPGHGDAGSLFTRGEEVGSCLFPPPRAFSLSYSSPASMKPPMLPSSLFCSPFSLPLFFLPVTPPLATPPSPPTIAGHDAGCTSAGQCGFSSVFPIYHLLLTPALTPLRKIAAASGGRHRQQPPLPPLMVVVAASSSCRRVQQLPPSPAAAAGSTGQCCPPMSHPATATSHPPVAFE
ncbi:uncharacterized protein LOC122004687 [Zingiber officinale]|uniref:uncharacterized protein LOC122004687 n=1 Tax=Zingiber officinale TaxID=94328 RepID=UPI001C4C5408|nr:uncharacterized protein LOC122004687 [Zingiber officinale]